MGVSRGKALLLLLTALLLSFLGFVFHSLLGPTPALAADKGKAAPALVQNLRYKAYSDYTRLVLDLQRKVSLTQSRQQGQDQIIIKLHNSRLGTAAKRRLSDKAFPEAVSVSQPRPHSVTLAINLNGISEYKLFSLSHPDRLVLDLFPTGGPGHSEKESSEVAPPKPAMTLSNRRPHRITTIVIDPGHGGKDAGAIGRNNTAEKDVTLEVGLLVRDMIQRQLGKKVLMTRDRDVFVELEDRAKFANEHGADLFISIHVNSHPRRSTRGLEIYHFGKASDPRALEVAARENGTPIHEMGGINMILADLLTSKRIEDSLEFAWTTKQAMIAYLSNYYDVKDHGVKTAPFYVLRFTAMPSILAEIAFISNPTEERQMRRTAYLHRMAKGLYQGIKAYLSPLQTAAK